MTVDTMIGKITASREVLCSIACTYSLADDYMKAKYGESNTLELKIFKSIYDALYESGYCDDIEH